MAPDPSLDPLSTTMGEWPAAVGAACGVWGGVVVGVGGGEGAVGGGGERPASPFPPLAARFDPRFTPPALITLAAAVALLVWAPRISGSVRWRWLLTGGLL